MPQRVSDTASNRRDQIANFAEILRNASAKQKVFSAVYFGKKSYKTVLEVSKITNFTAKRVCTIAKPLAQGEALFEQGRERIKSKVETLYRKIHFVEANKKQILKLTLGTNLTSYNTKTNPKINGKSIRIVLNTPFKLKYKFINITDIEQFAKAKKVKDVPAKLKPERISEALFKKGVVKLLKEKIEPKDWGGEVNDIFTTRAKLYGKMKRIAFALKGPGQTGVLVPAKMGKNGDQIQRLFSSPADVFFVQYEGEIAQSVIDLMENLAIAKAALSKEIFYGTIDKEDSYRLRIAYPKLFK